MTNYGPKRIEPTMSLNELEPLTICLKIKSGPTMGQKEEGQLWAKERFPFSFLFFSFLFGCFSFHRFFFNVQVTITITTETNERK
jgi:hypothetical protein